jgi:hypothetical protein
MNRSDLQTRCGAVIAGVVLLLCAGAAAAVDLTQIDDFEDGTTMDWREGAPSPNPPANVASGGPDGVDDNYLENISSGGGGPGSKMVMFNTAQWTGDYSALGPEVLINAHMANFGGEALSMRVAVESTVGGTTQYASTNAVDLPADATWYLVTFMLSEDEMTLVGGSQPLSTVLANVSELRILSSSAPSWHGQSIAGHLGVDNIRLDVLLFDDGFESSDTSEWTNTVP